MLLEQLRQAPAALADVGQDARRMDGDVEANMVTNRGRLEQRKGAPLAHPSDLHRLVVEGDGVLELFSLLLLQRHAGEGASGLGRIPLEGEPEVRRQLNHPLLVRNVLIVEDDQQLQKREDVGRQIGGPLAADDVNVAVLDGPQGPVAEDFPVRQARLSGKLREQAESHAINGPENARRRGWEVVDLPSRRVGDGRGKEVVARGDRRRVEGGDERGRGFIEIDLALLLIGVVLEVNPLRRLINPGENELELAASGQVGGPARALVGIRRMGKEQRVGVAIDGEDPAWREVGKRSEDGGDGL
jgi:hypothetical protein